jgi:hypothetical protein
MGGRASRRKGHDFERTIVGRLACVFGNGLVRRGLQYRDGTDCPDVVAPGLWIECKRGRLTNPRAALRQAVSDSRGKGLLPVAVTKDDGDPTHVTMLFDDFADFLAEWHALRTR